MGGKHWTKEEEGYYWNHIIPFSSKRVGLDKVRNKEKSWDLLAQEMTAKFGTTHRQYTSQSLAEHWFKNMQEGNYSKHAGPFVIQYLNKRAEEEEFHIENTDTKSKDSPLQEFADLDNATEEGESEISPQQSQTTVTVAQITSPGHSTDEFLHHSPLSESGVDVTLEPTLVDCPTNHSSSSNSVPGTDPGSVADELGTSSNPPPDTDVSGENRDPRLSFQPGPPTRWHDPTFVGLHNLEPNQMPDSGEHSTRTVPDGFTRQLGGHEVHVGTDRLPDPRLPPSIHVWCDPHRRRDAQPEPHIELPPLQTRDVPVAGPFAPRFMSRPEDRNILDPIDARELGVVMLLDRLMSPYRDVEIDGHVANLFTAMACNVGILSVPETSGPVTGAQLEAIMEACPESARNALLRIGVAAGYLMGRDVARYFDMVRDAEVARPLVGIGRETGNRNGGLAAGWGYGPQNLQPPAPMGHPQPQPWHHQHAWVQQNVQPMQPRQAFRQARMQTWPQQHLSYQQGLQQQHVFPPTAMPQWQHHHPSMQQYPQQQQHLQHGAMPAWPQQPFPPPALQTMQQPCHPWTQQHYQPQQPTMRTTQQLYVPWMQQQQRAPVAEMYASAQPRWWIRQTLPRQSRQEQKDEEMETTN